MPYLSLYRKYRPQTFADILGQEHVSRTLAHAIEEDRVAHAYLFTGPRGTGKTSTARILAKALNCENGPTPEPCGKCSACIAITEGSSLDVIEMDAASHSKVEETRDILTGVSLATAGGRKKVYVIDEVHMLTSQSFNALLKTLEEPPSHVVFVLATTEAHKVLGTIISRTQRFDFRRVPSDVIEQHLGAVAKTEEIDIEPEALSAIARRAEGSVRDALSALDQLSSMGGRVTAEDAERVLGERSGAALVELFDAVATADVATVFDVVHRLVAEGADPRQLALGALGHARSLLLLRTSPGSGALIDLPEEDRNDLTIQSERFTPGSLVRTMDLLGKAVTDMRNAPNHRLLLEVALVRATSPETDASPEGLLGRIERLERRMGIEGEAPPAPVARPPAAGPAPSRAASAAPVAQPAAATRPAPERTRPPARPKTEAPAPVPATTEQAPPAAAAPPPAPGSVGLGHIRDAWQATIKEVNARSRRVGAFLNPSRPVSLDDSTLTVEVQSSFHRDAMSDERNKLMVAEALHAALGVRFALRFVERGAEPAPEPEVTTASAVIEQEGSSEEADPIDLVKQDLGGEVVEEIEET